MRTAPTAPSTSDGGNSKIRTLVGSTVATLAGGDRQARATAVPRLGGVLGAVGGVAIKAGSDLFISCYSTSANQRRVYGPDP